MMLSDILERVIGPFLFIAALGAFYLMWGQQVSFQNDAKSIYLEDAVYSQSSGEVGDSGVVSRDDLIGILVSNPSISTHIEDPAQFVRVEINTSGGATMEITVTKTDTGAVGYHDVTTNLEGFPKEWVPYGSFVVSYEYGTDGRLKCVVYTKTGE